MPDYSNPQMINWGGGMFTPQFLDYASKTAGAVGQAAADAGSRLRGVPLLSPLGPGLPPLAAMPPPSEGPNVSARPGFPTATPSTGMTADEFLARQGLQPTGGAPRSASPPVPGLTGGAAVADAEMAARGKPVVDAATLARIMGRPAPAAAAPQGMIQSGMTGDQYLAQQGMQAGGRAPGPVPQALLNSIGPNAAQLQMMGAQPAMSFDGTTLTSRQIDRPAIAAALAGMRFPGDTMLYSETQQRMDPAAIAHRIAGQLAPTQDQTAEAFRAYNQFQQGAAGLLSTQETARNNAADLDLRRQMGLSGGVPTSLLQTLSQGKNMLDVEGLRSKSALEVAQLNAQNEDNKTADVLTLSQMPKDANGQPLPLNPGQAEALMRERMRLRLMGHPGVGEPPAAPGTGMGGAAVAAPDQHAQDVQTIRGGDAAGVGDAQLRAVSPAAVNAVLGEKDGADWKYATKPIMALSRLRELMPPDQYANNPQAISAFMRQHYQADELRQAPRAGVLSRIDPVFSYGRAIAGLLGKKDVVQQPAEEILSRFLGLNPGYQQSRADLRQLTE